MLLSLLSLNSLLSVTGGFSLRMHHDFSFHLSSGSPVDTESTVTHSHQSEDAHHHHELEVIAEMDPTIFGTEPWKTVQMPVLGVIAYLSNFVLKQSMPKIACGFAARAPPDVLSQRLLTLRTQVLRL